MPDSTSQSLTGLVPLDDFYHFGVVGHRSRCRPWPSGPPSHGFEWGPVQNREFMVRQPNGGGAGRVPVHLLHRRAAPHRAQSPARRAPCGIPALLVESIIWATGATTWWPTPNDWLMPGYEPPWHSYEASDGRPLGFYVPLASNHRPASGAGGRKPPSRLPELAGWCRLPRRHRPLIGEPPIA